MNFIKKNWLLILIIVITCVAMSSCSITTCFPETVSNWFNGVENMPNPLEFIVFFIFVGILLFAAKAFGSFNLICIYGLILLFLFIA